MVAYHREYQRDFEWKYETENFVRKLKKAAKKLRLRLRVKVVPIRKFISSGAQRWTWYNRFMGEKRAETRTVGYCVRWEYLPPKRGKR